MSAPTTTAVTKPPVKPPAKGNGGGGGSNSGSSKIASTPAHPVELLDNDIARVYAHVNPLLILSVYSIRFGRIVADPVPALLELLVPLGVLQIAYAFLCLPPYGGNGAAGRPHVKRRPGMKPEESKGSGIVPALLSGLLSFVLGTPILTVAMILFGAPLTTHWVHTLLCAAHMSLLATVPLIYVHGVDGEKWREIAGFMLPIDEVFGGALGCLLGAWVGAVPIPLDWDRDWQKWPVTIVTGAYIGYAIGKLAGGYLLKGKKIKFD